MRLVICFSNWASVSPAALIWPMSGRLIMPLSLTRICRVVSTFGATRSVMATVIRSLRPIV